MWCYLDTSDPEQAQFVSRIVPDIRYVIGFFAPNGNFIWHYGVNKPNDAEHEVHYLNGGYEEP